VNESERKPLVSGWRKLKLELKDRTIGPVVEGHVTFGLYFFIGVVVFGGLGFWYECARLWNNPAAGPSAMLTSLVTFFPALVGSTSIQMIFEEDENRRMRAFAVTYLIVFALLATALTFLERIPTWVSFVVSGAASLAALWIWWVANAKNPAFRDEVNDETPLGGSVAQTPAGTLDGFKS